MGSTTSNAIIILDLIQAGIAINLEIQNAIRQAELEGRNITSEELQTLADENDAKLLEILEKLGG